MKILIIGASSGLGEQTTKILSKKADVSALFLVSRNEAKLSALQAEVQSNGKECGFLSLDLSKVDEVNEKLSGFLSDKAVDVLFFNAGTLVNGRLVDTSLSDIEKTFNINTLSFIESWKATYPKIKESASPQVIVSGSMGGVQGSVKFPGLAAYSSSKSALASLCEVLAVEHEEENILFNCLAFGAINTKMLQEAFPDYVCDVSPEAMAEYVVNFMTGPRLFNGKVLPISITTP